MDLNGIIEFIKVIQAGSFTQAARILGMPKPTVSAKVARLEKRLGITLIQRTTRKLHVTPAGQAFFERCVRGLEEIQAGESELATTTKEPQGLLKITAPVDISHSILPGIVNQYLKKYPKTSIELVITNRVVDLVAEGVDLAIRAGELEDSSMIARRFISASVGLWTSRSYLKKMGTPKYPKELEKHEIILFTESTRDVITLSNGVQETKVKVQSRILLDDFEAIHAFILQGYGIGMLPDYLGATRSLGECVRVLPNWSVESGWISLVYPAQRFTPPKVQAFIDLAVQH